MNSLKKYILCFISLIFFTLSLSSQASKLKGIALCDYLYDFFQEFNFNVEKQNIVAPGDNIFPYNLVIHFDNQNNYDQNNLIVCVNMESAITHKKIIFDLISQLNFVNFNSTLLFIYDSQLPYSDIMAATGIDDFLLNLNTDKNYTAIIFDLDSEENTIQTGAHGQTSPSWLIDATYNAYLKEKLSQDLPVYYISQISKLKIHTNEIFSAFAEKNIPIISAGFNVSKTKEETISKVIFNFFDAYSKDKNSECNYHSLMIRIGNKKFLLSEYNIIKVLIIITFLSLAFVFILAYLNSSIKSLAWTDLRKNWYTVFVTFILMLGGAFFAKLIYIAFTKNGSTASTAFGLPVLQIIFSSALVSAFFLLEVLFHKKSYGERSIDIIIVLLTFINQALFCLIDVSLFPLFLFICCCSILSLILHRNWFHIVLFIVFIVLYIPYVSLLYKSSDTLSLKEFFINNSIYVYAVCFAVLPIFMMWLRILTAIQKKISKNSSFIIIISASFAFFMLTFIIFNKIAYSDKKAESKELQISKTEDISNKYIKLEYTDKQIFENTYRTIQINLQDDVLCAQINVINDEGTPVLYSENSYIQSNTNSAIFTVPLNPPRKMYFSYGTNNSKQIIEVKILKLENDTPFIYTKSITAGEK